MKEFSLLQAKENEKLVVVSIMGGRMATKRLADMGLVPGTKIKVLRKAIFGPIEIEVESSKLVLGRGLAAKVFVQHEE
jgi:ferrous iron transport protein A